MTFVLRWMLTSMLTQFHQCANAVSQIELIHRRMSTITPRACMRGNSWIRSVFASSWLWYKWSFASPRRAGCAVLNVFLIFSLSTGNQTHIHLAYRSDLSWLKSLIWLEDGWKKVDRWMHVGVCVCVHYVDAMHFRGRNAHVCMCVSLCVFKG